MHYRITPTGYAPNKWELVEVTKDHRVVYRPHAVVMAAVSMRSVSTHPTKFLATVKKYWCLAVDGWMV